MKFKKFIILSTTILASVLTFSYLINKDDSNNIEKEKIEATSTDTKESSLITSIFKKQDETFYKVKHSSLIDKFGGAEFKSYLEKISNFKVDKNAPNSQIIKDVSLAQYEFGNFFMSLASFAEGYSKSAYADNKGVATGFGYNISMQTQGLNRQMFDTINMGSAIDTSIKMSGKMSIQSFSKEELNNVALIPQRAVQVTEIMKKEFESKIPEIIGNHAKRTSAKASKYMRDNGMSSNDFGKLLLEKLKPNEKDVIIYHTYKVGPGGLAKYNNLLSSLVEYHFNNTNLNSDNVAKSFTYKYSLNGEIKQDTRASALITTMWKNPEDFKLVAQNAGVYPDKIRNYVQSIHKDSKIFNDDGSLNNEIQQLREAGADLEFVGQVINRKENKATFVRFLGA